MLLYNIFVYIFFLSCIQIQTHCYLNRSNNKNLSIEQWSCIRKLIQHQSLTPEMKQTTHRVIYSHYETWAIHKAYVFKRFHKYKCRDIDIEDLTSYSLSGLQKAVQNYNGKSFFHKYAEIYISGELYKGLTDLQPLNNIPTALKKKKQCLLKTQHNYIYKKRLNTLFVGYDEYWQL